MLLVEDDERLAQLTARYLEGHSVHVTIVHTNDLHGHVLPGPGAGGSAALATVVRRERPDLMLDAGDSFFGTMISNMFEGAPMIDAMTSSRAESAG